MGVVCAVNISEKRGTKKINIHRAEFIKDYGIAGDAHAGSWHRQVSLLSYESINAFRDRGAQVDDGDFGENLIVQGIDVARLKVGSRLNCGDVLLEVTQIGKECHNGCAIYKEMGECIMPREGIFARVIKGGYVKEFDKIFIVGGDD